MGTLLNTATYRRFRLALSAVLLIHTAQAQEETASGYRMNWTGDLSVEKAEVKNGKWTLSGHGIRVYEASAKLVMDLWAKEMKAQGASVSGSGPAKVVNASVPGVGPGAIMLFAKSSQGAKGHPAKLIVAFCSNDSTVLEDQGGVEKVMHDWAVTLNRAVVQAQIDAQQKEVDGHADKLSDAQRDEAKANKRSGNASDDLARSKRKKSKLSSAQADLESDRMKAEERYNRTRDPKDLERYTKIQRKLVKVQKDMSRERKKEAKAQKDLNKKANAAPDSRMEQNEHQENKGKATTELEALKRKLEAIR